MAENVQFLNKHVICYKNIGCCCTVVYIKSRSLPKFRLKLFGKVSEKFYLVRNWAVVGELMILPVAIIQGVPK